MREGVFRRPSPDSGEVPRDTSGCIRVNTEELVSVLNMLMVFTEEGVGEERGGAGREEGKVGEEQRR